MHVVGREDKEAAPADSNPVPPWVPEGDQPSDLELSLFEHVVLAIDRTNHVKR